MALSLVGRMNGVVQNGDIQTPQPWLRTLEAYLPMIRARDDNTPAPVSPALSLRYQGDFYGLLQVLRIDARYHWITMRLNGYNTPTEFEGNIVQIMQPNFEYIDQLRVLFNTLYRKNTQ